VAHKLEPGVSMQMVDVSLSPGEQIVDANNFIATLKQAIY
jgi:hypothetical protein